MSDIRIIAFYLPQFHPIKENDEWWGKGFTEWTNVGKAKPLFKGHNQPRVPTELGYYDLRMPLIREQQAQMAKDAGVDAFCYWHYWFGNGKRLMAEIFDEVLQTGSPSFPFCLGWANHTWYAKNWNADGSTTQSVLIEQTYPGIDDAKMHFEYLVKAFKDDRYIKIDGRPLLYIFDPTSLPNAYIQYFKIWAKEAGFAGLYLVANITLAKTDKKDLFAKGYDAVTFQRLGGTTSIFLRKMGTIGRKYAKLTKWITGKLLRTPPFKTDYAKYYPFLIDKEDEDERVIPTLVPQWDHTPRSGWNGSLFVHATPKNFYKHAMEVLTMVQQKRNKLVFLKSWNEWGEGNMMEPDLTYGRGFIEALRHAKNTAQNG